MLRLLSPFLWLGPVRLLGPFWVKVFLRLVRSVVLVALAALTVWGAFFLFQPNIPTGDALANEAKSANRSLDALAKPLKEYEIDPSRLRFSVEPLNKKLPKEEFYQLEMRYSGRESKKLLTVSPALYSVLPFVTDLARAGWWPIREVSFPAGIYAGSALLAEEGKGDLSASDLEAVRRLIDPVLEGLPSAKDDELATARRLVGPIQIGCYFLAAFAALLILSSWIATLLPNAILRSRRRHRLARVFADRLPAGEDRYFWRLRAASAPAHDEADLRDDDIPSPWQSHAVQATSADYEQFYAELGQTAAQQAGGRLSMPLIPLTELRRVGYTALRSAPGGDTVPGFVSVESDAIQESFDAKNRPIEYLIWAIPTLGFIGTVLGIGNALSNTIDIESSVLSTQTEAANLIGADIGLAFDTTFVALGLSFVLMLLFYALQSGQESMVAFEKRTALAEIIKPENIVSGRLPDDTASQLDEILRQIRLISRPVVGATLPEPSPALPPLGAPRSRRSVGRGFFLFFAPVVAIAGGLILTAFDVIGFH